jgi:hypothetical protein
MTTYNTGNPLGSTDPRDLSDNSENLDAAVNSTDTTWTDRFGRSRVTLAGQAGYHILGSYAPGIELTMYNQVIEYNGEFYRAAAGTLPYTTTATTPDVDSNLVSVGDAVLRQDLAAAGGAGLIGTEDGVSVQAAISARVITFDNVADMAAATYLKVGQKVRTLGYYTPGDGGGNDYEIVATGTGVDDGGSYIDLVGSGLQAKGLFTNGVISIVQFGAVGDQTTDCSPAINAAIRFAGDGGSVRVPKSGSLSNGYPSYYVASSIAINANDFTLYSEPSAEYTEGFYTDQPIDIIQCSGYGLRVENIALRGNGSTTSFGSANGLVVDRTSVGDAEVYSNLDFIVKNCIFAYLNDSVVGVGRNAIISDSLFSVCKRGVVGKLHTYNSGTVSSFRGWRILSNRFHSLGYQYTIPSGVAAPADQDSLDSWCVEMPTTSVATSHIEVVDNNADFCGAGFYKGYLAGAKISGNIIREYNPTFVYSKITDPDNVLASTFFVQSITDNSINGKFVTSNDPIGSVCSSAFVVSGVSNLTISNNVIRHTTRTAVVIDNCNRINVMSNVIHNANNDYTIDSVKRDAIVIENSPRPTVVNNDILSTAGDVYNSGIRMSGVSSAKLRNNTVASADIKYNVAPNELSGSKDEGLDWQTPSMQNGFTLNPSSMGYRRLFDGRVHISVTLSGGTDNTSAFNLPIGYRPPSSMYVSGVGEFEGAYALINAQTGDVVINWGSVQPALFSINVVFSVD